jgi:hypothetical protein
VKSSDPQPFRPPGERSDLLTRKTLSGGCCPTVAGM